MNPNVQTSTTSEQWQTFKPLPNVPQDSVLSDLARRYLQNSSSIRTSLTLLNK